MGQKWAAGVEHLGRHAPKVYGKYALVRFDRNWNFPPGELTADTGDILWVETSQIQPVLGAAAEPKDAPTLRAGDRVAAPFSNRPRRYPGRVHESYGKLVLVKMDDGDEAWVTASRTVAIPSYDTC